MDKKLIETVQRLRKDGRSFGSIAKELLITKSNACYCSKINLDEYESKRVSREKYIKDVCELATKCNSINQILHILGKSNTNEYYKQIHKILEDNNVDTSHFTNVCEYTAKRKKPIEELLSSGTTVCISHLRTRVLNEGLKEHKCERCGRTEWEGEPIPLQLHHINGDKSDNRLENIQLLCPNCHALTDNYCSRKNKKDSNHCVICGKEISRGSIYCRECFNENIKTKTGKYKTKDGNIVESNRPTKDILIEDFKKFGSFTGVGNKYGVTDKAVVKWCNKYDLPVRAIEMRKYIRDLFGKDLKWKFTNGNPESLKPYHS